MTALQSLGEDPVSKPELKTIIIEAYENLCRQDLHAVDPGAFRLPGKRQGRHTSEKRI